MKIAEFTPFPIPYRVIPHKCSTKTTDAKKRLGVIRPTPSSALLLIALRASKGKIGESVV